MVLSMLVAVGAAQLGMVHHLGHDGHRPIATSASYPPGMADDVRRPGFNGRLWVGRPILGAIQQGPYPQDWGSPGPEAYGAFGNEDATVYARVGHLAVEINPWESINLDGLKRYEAARGFWLQEQGYTGGVRTFVNDLYVWKQAVSEQEEKHASAVPTPRATITLPADMPRQRRRIRVDAGSPGTVACPGVGPARVSWPMAAPARVVERTQGGLFAAEASRVITSAK